MHGFIEAVAHQYSDVGLGRQRGRADANAVNRLSELWLTWPCHRRKTGARKMNSYPLEYFKAVQDVLCSEENTGDDPFAKEILDALASVGALRPPSPPDVVAASTDTNIDFVREQINEIEARVVPTIGPTFGSDGNGGIRETREGRIQSDDFYALLGAATSGVLLAQSKAPVVGKPPKELIVATLIEYAKTWDSHPYSIGVHAPDIADALLSAPIWPTAETPAEPPPRRLICPECSKQFGTDAPEPPATVDAEVEAVASRHENVDFNFPDVREIDYDSPNTMLQRAHKDRRILLTKLRQRTGSGITREQVMDRLSRAWISVPGYKALIVEAQADAIIALISGKKG